MMVFKTVLEPDNWVVGYNEASVVLELIKSSLKWNCRMVMRFSFVKNVMLPVLLEAAIGESDVEVVGSTAIAGIPIAIATELPT
jgi:hypothetical protein